MLGSSRREYILIGSCILLFRFPVIFYIAGVFVLWGVYGLGPGSTTTTFRVLITLLGVEGLFAATVYRPYLSRLQSEAKHPPLGSRKERQDLFEKCLGYVTDLEEYLQLWFLGADLKDIRRDDIRKFLFWGFLDMDPAAANEELDEEVEGYVCRVEEMLDRKLEPGTGRADCLRLTLDRVETQYRSFLWYGIISLADLVTHWTLSWNRFEYYAQPFPKALKVFPPRPQTLLSKRTVASDLSYWHRPHTAKGKLPVVFLHGIGIGLMTYLSFLLELSHGNEDGQIGIIAVEILPVSFRLTEEPLTKEEFVRQMTKILNHHGFDKFVLVSHSYGSVLTTHMIRAPVLEPRISSIVLVDPVSMLLHMPNVAYNFTRRQPKTAGEWQLWYFASMDPGVAHVLGRHFFWRDNIVWKEELTGEGLHAPRKAAVCLAGKDLIVDTATVARYLESDHELDLGAVKGDAMNGHQGNASNNETRPQPLVETVHFPHLDHAQVFDTKKNRERVLSIVRSYCSG